ncbi:MAG: biotin carboxylase [Ignavibacteria bacterium RIFOXYC2_FULL_35_16]|nr:MAG: biotin carboxylase [Ignavibacteria bacterium GWA2_36_19]OGU60012.1 MAG: biotin carboxylase [Ignavibacteria bacterium GWF2_35_20]OGU79865.1 MAG: biotin carboxylase [Ignavibacteria bacterium RIFOXYA2_FULL_35_9]OGU85288.1 MAG: biotin carboxylase [Ignavibacteria bacterium RIFOXYA12_FULL_35_25]OGV00461.1 MAG: biotin carboxylase [Ignavibacteria bacterium RIFOXYC2_FULL_35_16]OGV32509.1 MAG: biotin carboxylase [Ignavibacteria bacterium RIFOXYD12_FULL_36_8]
MIDNIKPKEATSIINSLIAGVVPKIGVQHIAVGRDEEIKAFVTSLEDVKNGQSIVKFWIGDFGSGKSFMLHLINTIALKQKFVIANADFTPDNRLYSNDGKGVALYSALIDNLAIQTKPEGGALSTLMEKWIEQIVTKTAEENKISLTDIRNVQFLNLIQTNIMKTINEITDVGGFDFGMVVIKYYEGFIKDDEQLRRNALKWLKGEYRTKSEARQDLGVREIINDLNFYDMLKNFCKLFVSIGYRGFMVNLDEAVNLYKISTSVMREKNYEKILTIYNDCFQGKVSNLFFNFAGTKEFLENERRGLFSYQALKRRLETNKYETVEIRDFAQPVFHLMPLAHEEIFILLKNLKAIFDYNYKTEINFSDSDIQQFMEEIFNKPGATEFLTPGEIIRDFLNILNIIRQNPNVDKKKLIGELVISDERPNEGSLDSVEEL